MEQVIAAANKNNNLFRIKFTDTVLSKIELVDLITELKSKCELINNKEFIKIKYTNNKFKINEFKHGVNTKKSTIFQKMMIKSMDSKFKLHQFNYSFQVMKFTEIKDLDVTDKIDNIKIIFQFQFILNTNSDWLIHVNISKNMNDPSQFNTMLSYNKAQLLKKYDNFDSEISESAYDTVQLQIIYTGDKELTKDNLLNYVKTFSTLVKNDEQVKKEEYQKYIFNIAKYIYNDPIIANRYKFKSGFKRLVNNVIEMSRPIYFKTILPDIENYYITDKIDGQRAMVIIVEHYDKKTLLGVNIKAISDAVYDMPKYSYNPDMRTKQVTHIFDAEMIKKDNFFEFFVFDVVCINNKTIANQPFHKRYQQFKACELILSQYNLGKCKTFIKLTKNYKHELKEYYDNANKNKYTIDGLIFTPSGVDKYSLPYHQRFKANNTEYYNTISFKWKPVEKQTIDFYMLEIPKKYQANWDIVTEKDESLYVLCSGVDINSFNKLQLNFFNGYKEIMEDKYIDSQYFPIQFSPDDSPLAYLFKSKQVNLHGKVGEFRYHNNKFQLERIRNDRDIEIQRGEYFGNALKYSELIWHCIHNPLTFELLLSDTNDSYFASDDNNDYFSQRAFNSFVKNELMCKYLKKDTIIDMMCGKGQDLARTVNNGFKTVYMIDQDIDAIYELLERKYNLRLKNAKTSANIHIRKIDVSADSTSNINELNTLKYLKKQSVDSVMINFAVHYIMDDINKITNAIKLVNNYIKTGGRVMITCFDGKKIFELLGDQTQWMGNEHNKLKYSIKKKYNSDSLMNINQAIDVLLPFSGNNYYEEYLVNMNYLISLFEANGFKLVKYDSFNTMLAEFANVNKKIYNSLSTLDKEYVSLYSFLILEKL